MQYFKTNHPLWYFSGKRSFLALIIFFLFANGAFGVSPTKDGLWNDASIWPNQAIPTINDEVTIPMGVTITLKGTIRAKSIEIMGTLRAINGQIEDADFDLETGHIMVMNKGLLEIGTGEIPYLAKALITLVGKRVDNDQNSAMGSKLIGGMFGSKIEIHGAKRLSWTTLNATAEKGSSIILLKDAVDWEVGDEIVIATTDYDYLQSEKRTITGISDNQLKISLDAPLEYMHYGEPETYSNDKREFILDMRAEVGLLSRNIKIQGDADSETTGFGGHMMTMQGSSIHAENMELFRMGQKSILARYPFHWHLAGDVTGQYIKNSSIHRSYNRVITVHGTDNAIVEGNVGYDHIGHGYFLEDGDEEGNLFKNNLGILTRAAKPGEETRPHDRQVEGELFKLPSTYWITNPNNDFIGNVAAGSQGSGFWMVVLNAPVRQGFWDGYVPGRRPFGKFDDNKSHSTSFSNFGIDGGINPDTHAFTTGHYRPENNDGSQFIPVINRFTGYKCQDRNVWMRANTMHFYDCTFAESSRHTFFSYNQILFNSLLVGKTNNVGTPVSNLEKQVGRSIPYPTGNINKNAYRGHSIYDGSCGIVDCHFAGYDNNGLPAYAFQTNGAAQKSVAHYSSGITFDLAIPKANKVDFTPAAWRDYMYASGLIDRDGSLTGVAGARVTPIINSGGRPQIHDIEFNTSPDRVTIAEWSAHYDIGHHYGLARLNNKWNRDSGTPIYAIRSDGPAVYNIQTYTWYSQNPVIVNEDYRYYWQYHKLANRIDTELKFVNEGDSYIAVIPNVPSKIQVNNSFEVSSMTELENSTQTSHLLKDNSLYLKIVAGDKNESRSRQFSREFEYSGNAQICVNNDCQDPSGRTSFMTLADFEVGVDSRAQLSTNGDLAFTSITGNGSNAQDLIDHKNSFSFTHDDDQEDEYVDYKLSFDRQVWTEFKSMNINFSGLPAEVIVLDKNEDEYSLGQYKPGASNKISLDMPKKNRDEVVGLILRFHECSSARTSTIDLEGITLSIDEPSSYSPRTTQNCDQFAVTSINNINTVFGIYPNPTSGKLSISTSNENVKWKILNLPGSIIQEGHGNTLDISAYPKGLYLINVEGAIKKIIKE